MPGGGDVERPGWGFRNGGAQRHVASFTIPPGAVPGIGCLGQECPQNSRSFGDTAFSPCVREPVSGLERAGGVSSSGAGGSHFSVVFIAALENSPNHGKE